MKKLELEKRPNSKLDSNLSEKKNFNQPFFSIGERKEFAGVTSPSESRFKEDQFFFLQNFYFQVSSFQFPKTSSVSIFHPISLEVSQLSSYANIFFYFYSSYLLLTKDRIVAKRSKQEVREIKILLCLFVVSVVRNKA